MTIHGEDDPNERVLRLRPFRIEQAGVAPGAGPHVFHRIDLPARLELSVGPDARMCLLVADERAVGCLRAVETLLVPDFPENLVAREEREVHAGIARSLDVPALAARPVLVVAVRREQLMFLDPFAEPIAVH